MELSQICRELFQKNGQIGYYLLGCQMEQCQMQLCGMKQKEEEKSGAVSACERYHSAKQRL